MLRKTLLAAVASTALSSAAFAMPIANPIDIQFNFGPTGSLTANTGDVTSATTITSGAPDTVAAINQNNVGLLTGQTITLTSPTPISLNSQFTQTFTTSMGTFTENLTVTQVTPGPSSNSITATGLISGGSFDPTFVYFSASYTQSNGPGGQINASFNDSTIAPTVPSVAEPASLAMLGAGLLMTFGIMRRRRS